MAVSCCYGFHAVLPPCFGLTMFISCWITVLDGIGKGLDPRFDISEIAKP